MIDQIRYSQSRRQLSAVQSMLVAPLTAAYKNRDPLTGQRIVELADGSLDRGNYLSDSEPAALPQYQPGGLGVPGYLNNR